MYTKDDLYISWNRRRGASRLHASYAGASDRECMQSHMTATWGASDSWLGRGGVTFWKGSLFLISPVARTPQSVSLEADVDKFGPT